MNILESLKVRIDSKQMRILDVGPLFQTNLFRDKLLDSQVDTMGITYPINKLRPHEQHIALDLNKTEEYKGDRSENYDIIVFSEVIEHLYTKPEIVLDFILGFLKKDGYIIIQTPNAVAIHKRLKLLMGRQPYNLLEENREGHFREYTVSEMRHICESANLKVNMCNVQNYFNYEGSLAHRMFVKLSFLMPASFKDGITVIAQKL